MQVTGAIFVLSIFTCYTFYRYIIHPDQLSGRLTEIHIHFQIYYGLYIFLVIYAGSLIAREVRKP